MLGDGWRGRQVADDGATIRLQPGVIGAAANRRRAPLGRKIGPDPASIDAAMVGGIAANNASGMRCDTAQNSCHTLASLRVVRADGTVLDTGDPASRAAFVARRPDLAESQRRTTRPSFLAADAGMTGANFAVAKTGAIVVCTNEGKADLSVHLPKLYIASVGIEKLLPRTEHVALFVRTLSRSALGSPITQMTSHFQVPRPGTEMHTVLVDNGRSARPGMADFWPSLKCIRCGACMNTCPVYRRSGGLSYGATCSGPIGVIIDPAYDLRKYGTLPRSPAR